MDILYDLYTQAGRYIQPVLSFCKLGQNSGNSVNATKNYHYELSNEGGGTVRQLDAEPATSLEILYTLTFGNIQAENSQSFDWKICETCSVDPSICMKG